MLKTSVTAKAPTRPNIYKKGRFLRYCTTFVYGVFILIAILVGLNSSQSQKVSAQNSTVNFQARILTSAGAVVPDGDYNVEFKLYDSLNSGATSQGVCSLDSSTDDCWWVETRTGGNTVRVVNGYVSVNLGSVTPFGANIPWNQDLYITMRVGGIGTPSWDSEMTNAGNRMKLNAAPYAFQASRLRVTNGANSTTISITNPTANRTITFGDESGTVCMQTSAACGFATGSGAAFVQGGNSFGAAANLGTADANVLNLQTNGLTRVSIDANGQVVLGSNLLTVTPSSTNVQVGSVTSDATAVTFVLDSYNQASDPTGVNGAMYYNTTTNTFRCYQNGVWVDCIGGAPYAGTTQSFVGGLQNVVSNQTASPIENMVFTAATTISNVAASGGITAPAAGSFRTCLVQNTAAITAGTLSLRWRVNGVSVGNPVCQMNATNSRQASSVENPGTVTFNAGDVIDVAFDTSAAFAPTGTNDFTVYWAVEYNSVVGAGSSTATLQDVYNNSLTGSMQTSNNKNVTFNLANTAIDSSFVVNIESGSTGRFAIQNAAADVFSVDAGGNILASGGLTVGNSSSTTAGTIRWTGTDFEGYDGASWISLTSGSGGSSMGRNIVSVVKQTNETINAVGGLQDDDELTFPIGANEEWSYRFVLQANSGTTPDFQFAVNAPAGAVCQVGYSDAEGATAIGQIGCGVSTGNVAGNGAADLYEITGTVKNGSTPGNVTLRWAQFTSTASNSIVYAGSYLNAVRSIGAGGSGQPFAQGGNAFGTTAVLGTSDNNDLSIITNGTEKLRIGAGGTAEFGGDIIANGSATGITGTTSGTGTNTNTLTLTADAFDIDDVIYIDNVGQDYYTRITADPGTGTYTINPTVTFENSRTVTKYNVQNVGATSTDYSTAANRFFQGYFLGGVSVGAGTTTLSDGNLSRTTGDITLSPGTGGSVIIAGTLNATSLTGDGSGITNIDGAAVDGATITNLDASNIAGGTLSDSRLSTNVSLLNGAQTYSALKTFGAGITISSGQTFTLNGEGFTDLTGTGLQLNSGQLEVVYGSTAGTAVQGNTTLTCPSGTGNLTGGGTSITLGSGGTCSALSTNNAVTFSTSVTTPLITGTGAVTVSSGGTGDLTLDSASNVLVMSDAILRRIASGTTTIELNDGADTTLSIANTNGSAVANMSVEGLVSAASFSGNGSSITSLNGANISSGTVADARLSTNVVLLNAAQSFSALKTFGAGATITAGQTFTVNGDGITDFTGTGLTLSGSSLAVAYGSTAGTAVEGNTGITVTAGTGLSGGGSITLGAGGTVTLNVAYGSAANTAVQGNTTLTCPSGTGNLTGGGTSITLGSGGTCSALSTNNAVTFSTSVTTPTLTSSSTLGINTTGANGITIDTGGAAGISIAGTNANSLSLGRAGANTTISGTTVVLGTSTLRRTGTGTTNFELNDTANTTLSLTNTDGTAVANMIIEGSLSAASLSGSGTGLTALDASNVSSGTLVDGRLSTNVAFLAGSQTFGGAKTFSAGLTVSAGQSITINSEAFSDLTGTGLTLSGGALTIDTTYFNANYIQLGSASLQTDSSNNATIGVNKTSATGNLITLQRSGAGVFTVANSGALQIRATSTTGLDIQNGTGTSLFTVDTSGNIVRIGSSTADATGVFLVFDTKNTTGDPAIGTNNNAQYYNSADGKYRCYEGGQWGDCSVTTLLGETTLGAAANTITVSLSSNPEYLHCRLDIKGRSIASTVYLRFNGDAGAASYAWNEYDIQTTAVTDAQDVSDSEIQINGTDTGTSPGSADLHITNFADTRKIVNWTWAAADAIGVQPRRYSGAGTWGNNTNAVSSVSFITSTGNFTSGSHAWCEGKNVR